MLRTERETEMDDSTGSTAQIERTEDREWLESLDFVYKNEGPERILRLFRKLQIRARKYGLSLHCPGTTPYLNTIPRDRQEAYPGSLDTERRIGCRRWIHWLGAGERVCNPRVQRYSG